MAANGKWCDLPSALVLDISERLDSDFDLLRIRSVCSPWRSYLPPPPPQQPLFFPLNLPPISDSLPYTELNGRYTLHEISYYRLSPSNTADPSNGWLLKVSKINPNTFFPLHTPTPRSINLHHPNILSLLHYRISEVRKSYAVYFHWNARVTNRYESTPLVKKAIVLRNYVVNFDFVVLILTADREIRCWSIGDRNWTPINTSGYQLEDVILCDGRCYALDMYGRLFYISSQLRLIFKDWAILSGEPDRLCLVECESDLYVVAKSGFELRLNRYRKVGGGWDVVTNLGDMFLVWCDDEMLSLRARDYGGCIRNSVYLIDSRVIDGEANAMAMVYRLDDWQSFVYGIGGRDSSHLNRCPPSRFGARYFYGKR